VLYGVLCYVLLSYSLCKCFLLGRLIGREKHLILRSSPSGQMFRLREATTLALPVKHRQCWFQLWFRRDRFERPYRRSKWSRSVHHLTFVKFLTFPLLFAPKRTSLYTAPSFRKISERYSNLVTSACIQCLSTIILFHVSGKKGQCIYLNVYSMSLEYTFLCLHSCCCR
jgi:hypothetical protein